MTAPVNHPAFRHSLQFIEIIKEIAEREDCQDPIRNVLLFFGCFYMHNHMR